MLTHENLAEQERKWRDSVDATDWLDEVDCNLNCDDKYHYQINRNQQLKFDQSHF